jgi:hypothetical protein
MDDPEMNEYQTAALSRLIIDHIRLAPSRRETLGWLKASVRKAGSVNLNRLAPHIEGEVQTIIITRHGRPIARLVPEDTRRQEEIAKVLADLDDLRKTMPTFTLTRPI